MTTCANGQNCRNPVVSRRPTEMVSRVDVCAWCANYTHSERMSAARDRAAAGQVPADEWAKSSGRTLLPEDLLTRIIGDHGHRRGAHGGGFLGGSTDEFVQAEVVRSRHNPNPNETLTQAMKSKSPIVRAAVLNSPFADVFRLRELMKDKDDFVAFSVGRCLRITAPADLVRLVKSPSYFHRLGMALREDLPQEFYQQLAASDNDGTIKAFLKRNSAVSEALKRNL